MSRPPPHERRQPYDLNAGLNTSARTIPASWYLDPAVHAAEQETVFRSTWQFAGRASQVSGPGAYLTTAAAEAPTLIARGEDRVLRAFYNVCRHRAARVATEAQGTAKRFRCRYHGWAYDLEGNLRAAPEFDLERDLEPTERRLPGLKVGCWGPFVFVNCAENPAALDDVFSPIARRIPLEAIGHMEFAGRREYELECNWKVYVDNYLDGGYHVNSVHPELAGELDYSRYRTEVEGETSVQISPMRGSGEKNSARSGDTAHYAWLFPNFMLNVYRDAMDTNLVLPLGPERCRVIFDFYVSPGRVDPAQSIAFAERVQAEDTEICEEVQRGLRSGAFENGPYSPQRERGVQHFHELLARELGS